MAPDNENDCDSIQERKKHMKEGAKKGQIKKDKKEFIRNVE